MKKIIFLVFVLLTAVSVARADTKREQTIDRALSCFAQEKGADGVQWIDVCQVQPASSQVSAIDNKTVPKNLSLQVDSQGRVTAIKEPIPRYTPLPEPRDFFSEKKHSVKVATETYYAKYEEPDVMDQDGLFWGISSEYAYQPQPGEFLNFAGFNDYRFQAQGAFGQMDYSSNGTGTMDDKDNFTFELRALMGSSMMLTANSRFLPYFGIGYRYLFDESENRQSSTGHWGYDRYQVYYYFPIGINWAMKMTPRTQLAANLEFDYMFWGHNRSELGYLPGYEDLEFHQDNGIGVRGSLTWDYYSRWGTFFISPFWRYWNIQDSNTVFSGGDDYVEPSNNTREIGVSLGIKF